MLEQSLPNIPAIVLLRSDRILYELIQNTINGSNENNAIFESVRDFYPNRYRLDEMEMSMELEDLKRSGIKSGLNSPESYNFSFMNSIFDDFFEFNGSELTAKERKRQDYIHFATHVDPYQIIGHKLASLYTQKKLEVADVDAICRNIKPLGYSVNNELYSDTHVHLKGSIYSSSTLQHLINSPTKKEMYTKAFTNSLSRINEFSHINNYALSFGVLVDVVKLCVDTLFSRQVSTDEKEEQDSFSSRLERLFYSNDFTGESTNWTPERIVEMDKLIHPSHTENGLLHLMIRYYNEKKHDSVHLLVYILFFIDIKNDTSEQNNSLTVMKLYLHSMNILRSYMVMSYNLGLSHFSEFSGSKLRNIVKANAFPAAKAIFDSGTNNISFKMNLLSTEEGIKKQLIIIQKEIQKAAKSGQHWNFCFSVNKEKDTFKSTSNSLEQLPARFETKRNKLEKQALSLDGFLRSVIYKTLPSSELDNCELYRDNTCETIDISNMVFSIDAVGKETHTPPEVFASFFTFLRRPCTTLTDNIYDGIAQFNHHPRLILTIHAGEDFNHIVTGIRRIYETVSFFEMTKSDRLGHALSLGVRPKDWINEIKEIILTKQEYFDNLVWLCMSLKRIAHRVDETEKYMYIYEEAIHKLFYELYPNIDNQKIRPTLVDLYDAWRLRKYDPMVYRKMKNGILSLSKYEEYSCPKNFDKFSDISREIFEDYMFNSTTRLKGEEIIILPKSEVLKKELQIWEALQDELLDTIASEGIIIETNPSSNIFISSLDAYKKHPIFRFCPPKEKFIKKGAKFNRYKLRKGHIGVTINSDDPAIFATTLQNEYALIKQAAIDFHDCTDKEAEDWLNEIRLFTNKQFKEHYYASAI
jgi:adenosine deaminase